MRRVKLARVLGVTLIALAAVPWISLQLGDRFSSQPPSVVARNWDGVNAVSVGATDSLSQFGYRYPPTFGLSPKSDGSAYGTFQWTLYASGTTKKPVLKILAPEQVDGIGSAPILVEDRLQGNAVVDVPAGSMTGLSNEVVDGRTVITATSQAILDPGSPHQVHIFSIEFHIKNARTRALGFKRWEAGFSYNPNLAQDYNLSPIVGSAGAVHIADNSAEVDHQNTIRFWLVSKMKVTGTDPVQDSVLSGPSTRHDGRTKDGVQWTRPAESAFYYRAALAESWVLTYTKWPPYLAAMVAGGIISVVYSLSVSESSGEKPPRDRDGNRAANPLEAANEGPPSARVPCADKRAGNSRKRRRRGRKKRRS